MLLVAAVMFMQSVTASLPLLIPLLVIESVEIFVLLKIMITTFLVVYTPLLLVPDFEDS